MVNIDNIQLVCTSCVPTPDLEDIQNISVGDTVKIIRWQERFWVEVLFIDKDNGNCFGRIDNFLLCGKGLQDNIVFNITEVIDIDK